jgi:outer membrane protein OmpA-like peptidoglycan-associated protein
MLKQCFTASMIALALSAHGADYVTASGVPLKSGFGECVHTGYWTPASEPCEAPPVHVAMDATPRTPAPRLAQSATVLFAFDGDALDDEARAALGKLLARFEEGEIEKVYVTAHADRIGGKRYNFALSERRLETVRNYLATKGITLSMLYTAARGADEPSTQCERLEPENRKNKALVECLRADRRAQVEVVGAPRELARTAKRAE